MSGIPGINVIASRDSGGPCATLCRHWYGEGFCISEATHGDFCFIHRNDEKQKPRATAKAKPPAERAAPFATADKVAQRGVWPTDYQERNAMEYLGLTPTDKRLDKALQMWRGGHRLKQIREAIGE